MAGSDISGKSTAGKLETLDLEGTSIVSGGGNYYNSNSTSNNIIGDYMFYNCSKLTTIKVPNNVTLIGNSAFDGCSSLSSITVPNSVLSIGLNAFRNCRNLKNFTIQDGTVELRFENAFNSHFSGSSIETLYLGRNLADDTSGKALYHPSPFSGNPVLKSVTIGSNVTMVNRNSFNDCIGLQSIILGRGLTEIGNNAFHGCMSLTGMLTIPNKVRILGDSSFEGCSSLSSITVPNSVLSIGLNTFRNCRNLKTFTIQDGTVELRFENAFNSHFSGSSIETLYLGRNLADDISGRALYHPSPFSGNSALKSVTIGNNVTEINRNSFFNCIGLNEIRISRTTPPTAGLRCFEGISKTVCRVYVPSSSVSVYRAVNGWSEFTNISAL